MNNIELAFDNLMACIYAIEERKTEDITYATYKDVSDIELAKNLLSQFSLEEEYPSSVLIRISALYLYLADQYDTMGRFSLSAPLYKSALVFAVKCYMLNGSEEDFIFSILPPLVRARNFYTDDDCDDIADELSRAFAPMLVKKKMTMALSPRRVLVHDFVEATPEYLSVIDEVERLMDEHFDGKRGAFPDMWLLKKKYLEERGVEWHTPLELNPTVRFD